MSLKTQIADETEHKLEISQKLAIVNPFESEFDAKFTWLAQKTFFWAKPRGVVDVSEKPR